MQDMGTQVTGQDDHLDGYGETGGPFCEDRFVGVLHGLKEDRYFADPSLSSSGAKLLLDSPAEFKRVVIDGDREEKPAFDLGSAVHAEVLGTGYGVEELDFDNWRTKASQEAKEAARAAGLIPMLKRDMVEVHATAQAVLAHPTARALLERAGHAEVSVFAHDPVVGVDVRCRFDFLPDDLWVALDLKTARKDGARVHKFAKAVVEYGYDVSWAHYTLTAALAGAPVTDMLFIVVETAPPWHVRVFRLNEEFKDIGAAKARRARETFARCIETGDWPGYDPEIQLIAPPQFAIHDHIDTENAQRSIT